MLLSYILLSLEILGHVFIFFFVFCLVLLILISQSFKKDTCFMFGEIFSYQKQQNAQPSSFAGRYIRRRFFFSLIRSSWKETRQKKKRNLENKIKAKQQCKELDSVTVFSGLS